jgi:hypothetical protein
MADRILTAMYLELVVDVSYRYQIQKNSLREQLSAADNCGVWLFGKRLSQRGLTSVHTLPVKITRQ